MSANEDRAANPAVILQDLHAIDAGRTAEALADTYVAREHMPIWKNVPFLERGDTDVDLSDRKQVEKEMRKVKQENKDLAAELDKVQKIYKLQEQIEEENKLYLEEDKKRLHLLETTVTLKTEDLKKKCEKQDRVIQELHSKLGNKEKVASV